MAGKGTKRVKRDELGRFASRVVPRRDELGRFALRFVPWRDELGRFASRKVPLRKISSRKAPPKESPRKVPRKALPRKVPLRKVSAPPKKVSPRKKVPPRKVLSKKVLPRKKVPSRKVPPRRKVPPSKVPLKKVPRKVSSRKVPRKRRRRKLLPQPGRRSLAAQRVILSRVEGLMGLVPTVIPGVRVAAKSFVNSDGTVDGELRVEELPEELREEENLPEVPALLSEVFRAFRPFDESPPEGGKYWVSFGVRFGPQNEVELGQLAKLYKKFRGLLQVATYPAPAWHPTPIQLAIAPGLKTVVEGIASRQGFPPSVLLVRFTWTPDGERPARWEGEGGGKK